MSEQAKALELAYTLEKCNYGWAPSWLLNASSAELRRLHSVNAELLAALQKRAQVDAAYTRLAMSQCSDGDAHEHLLQQIEDAEDAAKDAARAAVARALGQ